MRLEESRSIPGGYRVFGAAWAFERTEAKDARPPARSIAEAQRIDGMTPAALGIILAHIRYAEREDRKGAA